jgi:sulfate adenylyltransferase
VRTPHFISATCSPNLTNTHSKIEIDMTLISPHGGTLIDRLVVGARRDALIQEAERLPSHILSSREIADFVLIATGAASPLTGFTTRSDYRCTVEGKRLSNGLPWTIPVTLRTDTIPKGDRWALRSQDGELLGVLEIADAFKADRQNEAERVYGTTSLDHPGVRLLRESGPYVVGGPLWAVSLPKASAPDLALTPAETREQFVKRGWKKIVGFQTRNPVHRAHEYIQKAALEIVDGLLLHPLVGETKDDDLPADVRIRSYRVLLERYYPANRVLLAAFPAAMRYAGPREAIFHAILRKNYGCSHFIVGRDHAGVGKFYGTYDAQRIFDEFEPGELGIEPLRFEHTFYCRTCEGMASAKTCPHDAAAHVVLSGTRVRDLLRAGELPPPEFSRPEVAQILVEGLREVAVV